MFPSLQILCMVKVNFGMVYVQMGDNSKSIISNMPRKQVQFTSVGIQRYLSEWFFVLYFDVLDVNIKLLIRRSYKEKI